MQSSGKFRKILHVASFVGNSGDGAMHDGAYRTRQQDIPLELDYTQIEIRDIIHWRTRTFDQSFLAFANRFDAVIFGGDSLLQTWTAGRLAGTYFDFDIDYLDQIKCPIIFYGIGCDSSRPATEEASVGLGRFVQHYSRRSDVLFSVRNDGSLDVIKDLLDPAVFNQIDVIPDGGLFCQVDGVLRPSKSLEPRRIVLNLAGDMRDLRYGLASDTGSGDLLTLLAAEVGSILKAHDDVHLMLAPHIYSDLGVISDFIQLLDDRTRRTRVSVAQYFTGRDGWRDVFAQYVGAEAVASMRFHGNLVPIGLGVPTFGISTSPKVKGLYQGLNLADNCADFASCSLEVASSRLSSLFTKMEACLSGAVVGSIAERQMQSAIVERERLSRFHQKIFDLLQ